jgi:predicted transcriptional regulator
MKSVLISIQPKWCELIASGKKTVEVRKTRPKMETPFKVYIYCTKDNTFAEKTLRGFDDNGKAIYYKANKGKVIGEFVCDAIFPMSILYSNPNDRLAQREFPFTCLTDKQIMDYLGNGGEGYGWHITDLVVYDEPRNLRDFQLPCDHENDCGTCKRAIYCSSTRRFCRCEIEDGLKRPPQSWCYVERSKNGK